MDKNPNWNYTVSLASLVLAPSSLKGQLILDSDADDLIRTTFSEVPDIIDLWTAFPKPVLKADFFRYLITYAFGGQLQTYPRRF
jgi:hypothetical protein